MGCTLADHVGGSAGAGHRAAHRGPFIDHDGLDHQRINGQFRIILGVGQRGLERLIQKLETPADPVRVGDSASVKTND